MAIYKETEWKQPILTSATSYGTVTDSRNHSSELGWMALDSSSSTAFVPGTGAAWWKWELPEPITFKPESYIVWTHRDTSETFNGTMCRFFADAEGTIRLTDDFTDTTSSLATVTVPCSITEPVTTSVIYWTKDSGGGWGGASSINFYNVKSSTLVDVSGSVKISKGYYSDGSNKINMPSSTYNIDALTANQTLGGKNRLFAYTDSTDSVGALITSTTPTGSFKITKDLEHPVYLDPTKNYIAGGELIEPVLSFTLGTGHLWERPNLTSNTSYGTVSNSQGKDSSNTYAPWKALDGDTSSFATLRDDSISSGSPFWWKWELPHDIVLKPNSVLTFVQRNSTEGCAGWRFYADVEMTKPLGDSFSSSVSAGTNINIPCSNLTSDIKTNIIYLYNSSSTSWPGMAELKFSNVYLAGETAVYFTKALQYSGDQDMTYWVPSEATVSLASVKATQSVGPVNNLYLTTTAGTPTASLSFSDNGAIAGVATKIPLKQKVYLNNATDKILGVQERPDEISISGNADGISVSGWSALYSDVTGYTGNTALDYTTPTTIASSSLEIPSGAETAYLWYVNGDIKCKLPTDPVLDKAVFTGYALTLNNGTISGVVKRGELCAAFVQRGSGLSTRRYLFIPAVNLKDGSFTTRAGQGFYNMAAIGTLPPSEVGASMGNVEYDSTNKTAIFEGETFDYIGNMMCRLVG